MKVSTEIDNNFGYEKITQLVDNIPLSFSIHSKAKYIYTNIVFDAHCRIRVCHRLADKFQLITYGT